MEYELAKNIAVAICEKLQPFTDKVNIAGSIRRRKEEVKDIEVICMPKFDSVKVSNLFGDGAENKIVSHAFCEAVLSLGLVVSGNPTGRMMKIDLPEQIRLDLFIPVPQDYYRQYAIRTGSLDYSRGVIASGWLAQGWCGVEDIGLRQIIYCKQKMVSDKKVWVCNQKNAPVPPVWKNEEEFFEWIKVPWIHPTKRNIK